MILNDNDHGTTNVPAVSRVEIGAQDNTREANTMTRLHEISTSFKQSRYARRSAVVLPGLFLIAAIAAPVGYAAGPGASSADQAGGSSSGSQKVATAPDSYYLLGDTTNSSSGQSIFYSTIGRTDGAWLFKSNGGSVTNAVALTGEINHTAPNPGTTGVWGLNDSTTANGVGVWGTQRGTGIGVVGDGTSGTGVLGYGGAKGVSGQSGNGGIALYGNNTGNGSGFYGFSAGGPGGVMGSQVTEGARFYTRNASSYAIVTGGLTGAYGNVYINGNYQATGTKSARVETAQGARLMYAEEATTNLFSDQGFGQLVNGQAVVTIDPLYAQTVNLKEPYHVFLTPYSADTAGLAVVNRTATGFEVRELGNGKGSFQFSWKVEALRKGYEKDRLEDAGPAPATGGPAYEMPEATSFTEMRK